MVLWSAATLPARSLIDATKDQGSILLGREKTGLLWWHQATYLEVLCDHDCDGTFCGASELGSLRALQPSSRDEDSRILI